MNKFTLLIITLNELKSAKIIIPRIDKSLFHEVIVVDGGSRDGTIEFMRKYNFNVIVQEPKKYNWYNFAKKQSKIAEGIIEGVNAATGDYVILYTPDGNMIPEKLGDLINKSNQGYDLVCVSRYKGNAKSDDDHFISGFGNFFFTKLVNILFNANFTDVLGGYKSIKKSLWKKLIDSDEINVTMGTQISIMCARNDLKYFDIPGDEPKRIAGDSSRSIIINGVLELFTILKAYFNKNLYKI